ncbi:MAG: hypothetical protein HQK49_11220 [Oligoflexia bacterium]|nr:hypothetical protein [Oligoflexia bacterium]
MKFKLNFFSSFTTYMIMTATAVTIITLIPANAIDFKADVYSETGTQSIRENSPLNPSNRFNLNEEEFYTRAAITAKGSYKDSKGFVKFEGIYAPVDFTRTSTESSSKKDRTYLKAAYIDFQQEDWSAGIGKQFVTWGSGAFFYPLDIINYNRDPLRPLDEAEGNSYLRLSSYYFEYFTPELFIVTVPERSPYQLMKAKEMQLVPKISFTQQNLSGFFFARLRGSKRPLWGANLSYVNSIFENTDLTLYVEGILRSDREKLSLETIDNSNNTNNSDTTRYPAMLLGMQTRTTFTTTKWIDGIIFNYEYFYDRKNWSKQEFNTFLTNPLLYYSQYSIFTNSRSYNFFSIFLESFLYKDLKVGCGSVMNSNDNSVLYLPEISYSLSNQNARIGVRAIIFTGNSDSEFGTYPLNNQILGYGELTF